MIHDTGLLDKLDALPKEAFSGDAYRATRQSLEPLVSSSNGGRWMPKGGASVLYTSLAREGALAEIAFHWSQLTPRPSKPVLLHTLVIASRRTLRLVRADFTVLGISDADYDSVNPPRTQEIGAAIEFLGCDGLIAPSARWDCDHLILFPDSLGGDTTLEVTASEQVDWVKWAIKSGLLQA